MMTLRQFRQQLREDAREGRAHVCLRCGGALDERGCRHIVSDFQPEDGRIHIPESYARQLRPILAGGGIDDRQVTVRVNSAGVPITD